MPLAHRGSSVAMVGPRQPRCNPAIADAPLQAPFEFSPVAATHSRCRSVPSVLVGGPGVVWMGLQELYLTVALLQCFLGDNSVPGLGYLEGP
jgi:hypothetical protein